jgi:hypothetical protein
VNKFSYWPFKNPKILRPNQIKMLRSFTKKAKPLALKPVTLTQRNLQSQRKPAPGFFDSISAVYEHPDYHLAIKPYEWRDGQLRFYATNHLGMIICIWVCACPLVMALFCMIWYSTQESHITFFNRSNNHANLQIHSGADDERQVNPLFNQFRFLGYTQTLSPRNLFYLEIEAALEAKNKK